MNNNFYKLIVLLFLGMFLLGCTSDGNDQGLDITKNFKTGISELELFSTTIPDVIFQNNEIKGELTLKNKGWYDVENVQVSLLGLDKKYVSFEQEIKSLNAIPGRSLFNQDGGEEILNFEGNVGSLLPNADQNFQKYLIFLTYSSIVEFSPTICVDSGLYSVGKNCDFKNVKNSASRQSTETFSGQGAPIAFNNLEIIPYTGRNSEIELRMKVQKRGRGDLKSLRLGVATLGNIPLQCDFKGRNAERPDFVEFNDKTSTQEVDLVCVGKLESGVAYETSLFVEVFYDYELEIRKNLEIRR